MASLTFEAISKASACSAERYRGTTKVVPKIFTRVVALEDVKLASLVTPPPLLTLLLHAVRP